jgi:hypothetical protein
MMFVLVRREFEQSRGVRDRQPKPSLLHPSKGHPIGGTMQ